MRKILSSKPNSQTQRRSADRKADHALRPFFERKATMEAIVYTTNTGSTEQYARLLAQKTGLPACSLAEAKKRGFAGAEVVYLGWIMAGSVKGYTAAAKRYRVCAVCGVGMGQTGTQTESVRKKSAIPANIPLFTLQGNARQHQTGLTVMPGGEHWFHTGEQMQFLRHWLRECRSKHICCRSYKIVDKREGEKLCQKRILSFVWR